MSNGFVLGCDGGNTKTIALVAAPSGEILGWGRAGSSDVHDNPAAIDELRAAVRAAWASVTLVAIRRSASAAGMPAVAKDSWLA